MQLVNPEHYAACYQKWTVVLGFNVIIRMGTRFSWRDTGLGNSILSKKRPRFAAQSVAFFIRYGFTATMWFSFSAIE